ncbi:MAG: DnaD domain protein [Eubacteriales bacterium]|nr:DnaD domain protein [Eubacteriales bacterium]
MSGYILRQDEKSYVLSSGQIDTLIQKGDGDAVLLYLFLLRSGNPPTKQELMRRLRWSELRLDNAERALQQMGLIDRPAEAKTLEPAEEKPAYSSEDMATFHEDPMFEALFTQVQEKLGKKLNSNDSQILANLYDCVGLPCDVIYLLLNHCLERAERKYGVGRKPTMRQMEKEGYYWARQGLYDQESAAQYLREYDRKRGLMAQYMKVLGIGGRPPVVSEERYIRTWIDWGFDPDTVAMAYDKTVFYKKELKWPYLNGILKRWHEQGWHSVAAVEQGEQQKLQKNNKAADKNTDKNAWMEKYM